MHHTASQPIQRSARARAGLQGASAASFRKAEVNRLSAAGEDRRTLAFELHDGVGQLLTAAGLKARSLLDRAGSDDGIRFSVSDLQQLILQAQNRLRDIARGLAWEESAAATLAPGPLLKKFTRGFGLALDYAGPPLIAFASSREARQILLILQESVLNAKRHGRADRIVVSVRSLSDCWIFRISDNGCGFSPASDRGKNHGLGIPGMQKRAVICGGNLDLQSSPGRGTVVRLSIPRNIGGIRDQAHQSKGRKL